MDRIDRVPFLGSSRLTLPEIFFFGPCVNPPSSWNTKEENSHSFTSHFFFFFFFMTPSNAGRYIAYHTQAELPHSSVKSLNNLDDVPEGSVRDALVAWRAQHAAVSLCCFALRLAPCPQVVPRQSRGPALRWELPTCWLSSPGVMDCAAAYFFTGIIRAVYFPSTYSSNCLL